MKSLSCKKNKADFLLMCFYFTLLIYPFYSQINALTGTAIVSFSKEIIFLCLAGFSFFSLLKNRALRIDAMDMFLLGYMGMVLLNAIRGPLSPIDTLHALRYRLLYLVSINLFLKYLRMKSIQLSQMIDVVMNILFYTGIFVVLIAMLELYKPETIYRIYGEDTTPHLRVIINKTAYRRVMSTLSNPINMGFYMVLSSIAGLYLLSVQKGWRKALYIPALLMMLYALLHTYSRGAYVSIICMYFGWCFVFLISGIRLRRISIRAAAIITISVIGVSTVLFNADSPFVHRLVTVNYEGVSTNTRILRAQNSLSIASPPEEEDIVESADRPDNKQLLLLNNHPLSLLLGNGIGTIIGGSQQYVFELGYLSVLYESGLISLLCLLTVVFIAMLRMVRTISHAKSQLAWQTIACFAILGTFLVTMLVEDTYMQLPMSMYLPLAVFQGKEHTHIISILSSKEGD